ncbi:phosphate/phosphite/phosphonate ABC transporter substrate-binding protein, partial [Photobacterium sanctipauli]
MRCVIAIIILMALSWPTLAKKPQPTTLSIGVISNHPSKHIKKTKPIAAYLQQNLEHFGYKNYEVIVKRNVNEMVEAVNQGKVDIISETLYGSSILYHKTEMEPALVRWKKRVARYNTYFITHKDNEINTIKDIKGKTLVFEDPGSTSGYYLPMMALERNSLSVNPMPSLDSDRLEGVVNSVFSSDFTRKHNEVNISTWVFHKKVDVGVISNVNWNDNEDVPDRIKGDLKVIHKTPEVPRAYLLIRASLP